MLSGLPLAFYGGEPPNRLPMTSRTLDHLIRMVLPAAAEYFAMEEGAVDVCGNPDAVLRKAYETSIALDGLVDRASTEFSLSKREVIDAVDPGCKFPIGAQRPGCIERIRAVANAYKHADLNDKSLPLTSDKDVFFYGAGFGVDGYGVGKSGGMETLMRDKAEHVWKFLGDVPCAVYGWVAFLRGRGVPMPGVKHTVCNLEIEF